MNNSKRGAYYKARTRRWLETRGWQVADMEVIRWVNAGAKRFGVKRDQLASDLLAVNSRTVAFIQVKGGKTAGGNGQFLDAQRKFQACIFPQGTVQAIVAWSPGAKRPRIIRVPREPHVRGRE